MPNGSVWARNPIPRNAIGTQSAYQGQGFEMPPGCAKLWGAQNMSKCQMMTDGSNSVPDMEIIDRVAIPPGTPAGEYVLGWRWDCEVISLPPCPLSPALCPTHLPHPTHTPSLLPSPSHLHLPLCSDRAASVSLLPLSLCCLLLLLELCGYLFIYSRTLLPVRNRSADCCSWSDEKD